MKVDTTVLTVIVSLIESNIHTLELANIDLKESCNNFTALGDYAEEASKYFNEYEMNFTENISKLKQMTYFISNNVIKEYGIIEKELAHNFEDLAASISEINK